jgi:hypothetical protein
MRYVINTNTIVFIADLLAKEAAKTYDIINSLTSMLHEIESILPHQERLYPLNSPHKKHYPKLHSLLQNRPPRLQATPTASVSLMNHNSHIRTVSTFSSSSRSLDRKSSVVSTKVTPVSHCNTFKSEFELEPSAKPELESEIEFVTPSNRTTSKLELSEPSYNASASVKTPTNDNYDKTRHSSSTKSNIIYSPQKKIPIKLSASVLDGNADIAFLSTDEDSNDDENIDDQEEDESDFGSENDDNDDNIFSYEHAGVDLNFTSPVHLSSVALPTTSVSTTTISPDYPPAMFNLLSVLPQSAETTNYAHHRKHSFDSLDSAGSNTSLKSIQDDIIDVSKKDRRKSAPYMLRQASGILSTFSGNTSPSSMSVKPKSFTLTSFFANAWAGAASKLGIEEGELPIAQSPVRQNAVSSSSRTTDYEVNSDEDGHQHTLDDIFRVPNSVSSPARDRRKSTASAKISLQRLIEHHR